MNNYLIIAAIGKEGSLTEIFNMATVAKILEEFGAWGMCAILIAAIIYLYRSMGALLEKRNDQFVELLKETSAVLQTIVDQNNRIERLLDRVEDRLNE